MPEVPPAAERSQRQAPFEPPAGLPQARDHGPLVPGQAVEPWPRPPVVVASVCVWVAYLALDGVTGIRGIVVSAASVQGFYAGALAADMAMLAATLVMLRGRNWSRIVLAVCGGMRVLFGLPLLVATANKKPAVLLLLPPAFLLLLLVVAVVLMFLPRANRWFAHEYIVRAQAGQARASRESSG